MELATRWRAALEQPRRVRSRSMRAPTRMPPRNHPAAGAATRGRERTALRAIASLGPVCAARGACARAVWAERSNGPDGCWLFGCSAPHPLCMRRGAQRPADQGSRLSERSAAQRVRARPRWTRAPQVARSEAQGRRQWGRLFFAYFLLAKQKKVTAPPGALPGSRPMQRHEAQSASNAYRKSAASYKNRSIHHTAPRLARHLSAHPSNVK